jgi:hypothetical protein
MTTPSETGGQDRSVGDLPDAQPQLVSAVIPGRLAAPTPPGTVNDLWQKDWWKSAQQVASDWQKASSLADFWELALVPPVQPGRGHELAGLIASGGEQFVLALTALAEAELWNIYRQSTPSEVRDLDEMEKRVVGAAHEMGHRAMAELAAYYLLATGHTIANVTIRAMALDSRLHTVLLDALGGWCPVGSQDPKDWLSLNRDTVRALRRVAKKTPSPAFQALVKPAGALVLSHEWQELGQLRGAHYHRWRPQSAGMSGVPLTSPWVYSNGTMNMNFGGREYTDGNGLAHDTTDLARRMMSGFTSAMAKLLEQVKAVVAELQSQKGRTQRPRGVDGQSSSCTSFASASEAGQPGDP